MSNRRLTKSRNHWVDGVIGGVGNYFKINPDIIRVAFLIGFFMFDFSFLIPTYIVLMIFMPSSSQAEDDDTEYDSNRSMQIIGVLLILGGIYYIMRTHFNTPFFREYIYAFRHFVHKFREWLIPAILIGAGVWLFQRKR